MPPKSSSMPEGRRRCGDCHFSLSNPRRAAGLRRRRVPECGPTHQTSRRGAVLPDVMSKSPPLNAKHCLAKSISHAVSLSTSISHAAIAQEPSDDAVVAIAAIFLLQPPRFPRCQASQFQGGRPIRLIKQHLAWAGHGAEANGQQFSPLAHPLRALRKRLIRRLGHGATH